jgi:hypothetical protein
MGINGRFVGGRIEDEDEDDDDGGGGSGGGGFFRLRVEFLLDFFVEVRRLFVGGIDKSIDFD